MPLDNFLKISLTHKEAIRDWKSIPDTCQQGVPQRISRASLTIEAALVFPVCFFVLVGILFLFRVMQVNTMTADALAETASWLALETGVNTAGRLPIESGAEKTEEQKRISLVQAVGYFQKELLERDCPTEYILGGGLGIDWEQTKLDGEYVDLQIRYMCKLPVSFPGIRNIPIVQRVRMKKWTGYHGETEKGQENDRWVYITPNGEVYHLRTSCTHLKLSVETMEKNEAKAMGYTPCLLCKTKQSLYSYYYVTEEGQRYHTRLDCSGLKRTVSMIRLSQVGNRSCCSRCGGE